MKTSGVARLGETHSGPSITCKMLRFLQSSGLKIIMLSPVSQKIKYIHVTGTHHWRGSTSRIKRSPHLARWGGTFLYVLWSDIPTTFICAHQCLVLAIINWFSSPVQSFIFHTVNNKIFLWWLRKALSQAGYQLHLHIQHKCQDSSFSFSHSSVEKVWVFFTAFTHPC